jgi:glycosyltransferase involved in cell wall biosynthesis
MDFVGKWHSDPAFQQTWEDFLNTHELQDWVQYHGAKYGAEKQVFFEQAGIFALPTFYKNECFPISILEAMSFGLPVVSTTEGAISEIVIDGETGYSIPKNRPEALADALQKLLVDKTTAQKMGANALGHFNEKYTLEVFERNMVKTLKDIIRRFETTK